MAGSYDIGRPTVRQATDLLVRQGRLERRRGSGTYVLPPTRAIDLFSLAGTSAALNNSELNASLFVVEGPLREPATEEFEDRFRVQRCASVDGTPVLIETLWFNAALFHDLDKHALADRSISALVKENYFLEPSSAEQTFYAIAADCHTAKHLNINKGTPVLRVLRELHFGDVVGALQVEIVCLTDQFEFSQTLIPVQAGMGSASTAA